MQARVAIIALAACTVAGCTDGARAAEARDGELLAPITTAPSRPVEGSRIDDPVVIVTIDGVRWKEVFEGTDPRFSSGPPVSAATIAPNLHKLGLERGAFVGAPGHGMIAASGPNYISLPGYTEILGGRPSAACQRNDCARTRLPTILDEARAAGAKVAAFASWSPLELAATSAPGAFLVSCGLHDEGGPLDPFPGYGDYRPDRVTANVALAYLEAEHPDVFFLGLGDPDEYAHRGDYAAYLAALRQADDVIGRLLAILDRSGERGQRTHIVVTSDHGRAESFRNHGRMAEAARVWMAAAGPRFHARGRVTSMSERHLADIAPTLRRILGLPPDASEHAGRPIDELFTGNVPGL
jgi:hypothetical protein